MSLPEATQIEDSVDRMTLARKQGLAIFEQRFLRMKLCLRRLVAHNPGEVKVVGETSHTGAARQ
jgi:hypothetical protein